MSFDIDRKDVQFIDLVWLSTFGLTETNVLQYFYQSPFYDAGNSDNEVLRRQGVDTNPENMVEHLKEMRGIQYTLDTARSSAPHLFIIRQEKRHSRTSSSILSAYYCLDGLIYKCPHFRDILHRATERTSLLISQAYTKSEAIGLSTLDTSVDRSTPSMSIGAEAPEENRSRTSIPSSEALKVSLQKVVAFLSA